MKTKTSFFRIVNTSLSALVAVVLLAGCQSNTPNRAASISTAAQPHEFQAIRIKAGTADDLKDASGNIWLADRGFTGGDTVERPDLTIANAADQRIYQSERYSMTQFMQALPNGKYTVKLHFCETYDGITGPGQRIFSFNVAGRDFKNFDIWARAGGGQRAYVETVPVEITTGKLVITFTSDVENPQINGIEILPAS